MRDALRRLTGQGIVAFEPYIGFSVRASPTVEEIRESYQARECIEVFAAEHIAAEQLAALESIAERIARGPYTTEVKSFLGYLQADHEFHELLLVASGNRFLHRAWLDLKHDDLVSLVMHERGVPDLAEVTARTWSSASGTAQRGSASHGEGGPIPHRARRGEGPGRSGGLIDGLDMGRFPTAGHLASWAKLSPRTIQSGPTTSTGKTGKNNPYLQVVLGAAARTNTFLGQRYRRLVKRRGKLKALVAVARSILVIVWHLLADPDARFHDLGTDYHTNRLDKHRQASNHLRQLRALGFDVILTPAT